MRFQWEVPGCAGSWNKTLVELTGIEPVTS